MSPFTKIILYTGIGVATLAGILWYAQPNRQPQTTGNEPTVSTVVNNTVQVDKTSYDFGTISMKDGNVNTTFAIQNTQKADLLLTKLYTSCMCTTALLKINGVTEGPFGMPGHGLTPKSFNQALAIGQTAEIEVEFDPNAHGPSGVGVIERQVILETPQGRLTTFDLKANVIP